MSQEHTDQQVLLTLVRDTMKQTLDKIEDMDHHIDQIGRTVVSFSKIVVDSHDSIHQQQQLIGDLAQNTFTVNQHLEDLNSTTVERYEHQKHIEHQIDATSSKIDDVKHLQQSQYDQTKEQLEHHHKQQYDQLVNANEALKSTLSQIQNLDINGPMAQFSKNLETMQQEIKVSRDLVIEQVTQLSDYAYDLNTHLTELMSDLTKTYEDLSQPNALDTMTNQLSTIELYLKTLVDMKG